MTHPTDLDRLALQEQRLQFPSFDADTAWALGSALRTLAEAQGAPITVEVRLGGETVFFHAMAGAPPANADWARRKRNTVELMHRSSYRVGRELARDGQSTQARREVRFALDLAQPDLRWLLQMTPYAWKARPERRAAR